MAGCLNTVHPSTGFHKAVFDDLRHPAEKLNYNQKYVVFMLDKVSIKDDLVYYKVAGELVNFETPNIATHALVVMVTNIASRLKYSLSHSATATATENQLFLLMWKVIGLLETYANLNVVLIVSDKAGPNQRLYNIHNSGDEITYRTKNVFATDKQRYVYFISDHPHLLKTARNHLASSGSCRIKHKKIAEQWERYFGNTSLISMKRAE